MSKQWNMSVRPEPFWLLEMMVRRLLQVASQHALKSPVQQPLQFLLRRSLLSLQYILHLGQEGDHGRIIASQALPLPGGGVHISSQQRILLQNRLQSGTHVEFLKKPEELSSLLREVGLQCEGNCIGAITPGVMRYDGIMLQATEDTEDTAESGTVVKIPRWCSTVAGVSPSSLAISCR